MSDNTTRRLTAPLRQLIRLLPKRPPSDAMVAALNLARLGGKLNQDWTFLTGKHVCVHISDLNLTTHLGWNGKRFVTCPTREAGDVTFTATTADYLKLLRREEDPDTLFFQRRLQIEGDTELGLTLKNMLDSIELPGWLVHHA
ncbi:ubiquinone anaerobic biosynthesis accessory factor UbiT [Leeia oryzae]|uniref:ubiquinone anaerobic biosynthesis accessory factor UbiT n=1 Tax=Leeia oryzae TaxID=356662 RepID=UPI000370257B|nr:SCP2 sterol-binding domain-containing protein [Leeia oryzae]